MGALQQAIASGEFLIHGTSDVGPTASNAYLAMRYVLSAIEKFRRISDTLESREREWTAMTADLRSRPAWVDIPNDALIYLFAAYDRLVDIMSLSVALLVHVLDPTRDVHLPPLSPVSPLEESIEGLKREHATHEDVEQWVTDGYMRGQMTNQTSSGAEDATVSRRRFPEYWKTVDSELDRWARGLIEQHGQEFARRRQVEGLTAAMTWLTSLTSDIE